MKNGYMVINRFKSGEQDIKVQYLNKLVKIIDETLKSEAADPLRAKTEVRNFERSDRRNLLQTKQGRSGQR